MCCSFALRESSTPFVRSARITVARSRTASSLAGTIRCPLHHACFDLATGDALCAPALDPLPCWRVERQDGRIVVGAPLPTPSPHTRTSLPSSVVILGGGAAGLAAADTLRREGYDGPVSIVSADSDSPVDRPNLSKDYLAGEAQDDWLPLWPSELYAERRIDLALMTRAERIEPESRDGAARRWSRVANSVRC